jgi:hypothetical protein
MPKSLKVRKESSKRERREGRTSEEGTNPFRKSSRTGRSPGWGRRKKSKEMDKEMKTIIREIREDMAGIREESQVLRLDEKNENDRGKDGTKRKEGEEE